MNNKKLRSWTTYDSGKNDYIKVAKTFGNFSNFVKEYYKQIRLLAKSGLFDTIGHIDLIKKYNYKKIFFDEEAQWYKNEVMKTLKQIAQSNLSIEINTKGLVKECRQQWPSYWIIQEACKLKIPITIGSDRHLGSEDLRYLDTAIQLAKKAGYDQIIKYAKRKIVEIEI